MIRVSIIGATGYTGQVLTQLLLRHPHVASITLASQQQAGKAIPLRFLHYAQNGSDKISPTYFDPESPFLTACDIVFFATPNGLALRSVRRFIEAGCRVIDLSADFRLKDTRIYQNWYQIAHSEPALLDEAVYGLSEFNALDIRKARLVANPGCYATAVQLALAPLLMQQQIETNDIIVDAKSGVSGAGKKLSMEYLFSEVQENFRAYAVAGHRHHPEILQGLQVLCTVAQPDFASYIDLIFTPHLIPMQRGIFATIYAHKAPKADESSIRKAYTDCYQNSHFVLLHPSGTYPDTAMAKHTNDCHIAFHVHASSTPSTTSSKLTIMATLDNMMKGAAGQAVQNMNLMLGFDERDGLI